MNKQSTTPSCARLPRRDFIITASAFVGLGALAGCARDEDQSSLEDGEFDAVAALISVLFPHQDIAASTYRDIATIVRQKLEMRDDWQALRVDGDAALKSGGGWASLDEAGRVALTEAIQESAFFKAVYQTALIEFYSHPDVWHHVGYPGSSVEEGGYFHRGFDNIDWLPGELR